MAKLNSEERTRALDWMVQVNMDFDNLTMRLRNKWLDWYRMYRVFENQERLPGQSNIFIPKIFEIIEKKVPPVIAKDPKFIVTPRTNEATVYVGAIRDALNFWWDEDGMQEKLETWVKDAFIYGVGFLKVDWYQETKVQTSVEVEIDDDGNVVEKEYEEEVISFERPTADLISIFDVKVDPRVENFKEGVGVLQTLPNMRFGDLLKLDPEQYDLSEIKGLNPEELHDSGFTSTQEQEQEWDKGINDVSERIDKNKITLQEYWGQFSKSGKAKDEREYVITAVVVGGIPRYIIRCEVNELGFRPFVKMDDRKIRGEFYSVGEVEPLEGLQVEYNNLRNARLDFNNAVNFPEWIYNINAGINPANLVHRPNNIIPVDLPLGSDIRGVIRPVEKPIQPMSGYNEEAQLNRDFQTVSQTVDFTDRGGSAGFTNTARGILARDAQVNTQVNNIVKHLESSIAELGEMWLALAENFAEESEAIVVRRPRTEADFERDKISLEDAPQKFTKIDTEVLGDALHNYQVKIESGSTTAYDSRGKAQDAVNIANTAVQYAAVGVPVNLTKIFKDILRDSFQKANPESYLMETPQQAGLENILAEQMIGGGIPEAGNALRSQGAPITNKAPLQPSQPSNY